MAQEEEEKDEDTPWAIVTGLGPGLGYSIASKFASEGYNLLLSSRSPLQKDGEDTPKAALVAKLKEDHPKCEILYIAVDCGDENSINEGFASVANKITIIKALIWNVGPVFKYSPLLQLTSNDLTPGLNICVIGLLTWSKIVIPNMLKNGGGSIIASGATASLRSGAKLSSLAIPKFAQRALIQSMGREYQPQGIHCATIILDGIIKREDKKLNPDDAAQSFYALHTQPKGAWTHEMDLRPYSEKWTIN